MPVPVKPIDDITSGVKVKSNCSVDKMRLDALLKEETKERIDADNHLQDEINNKQDTLVSGENIKTLNGESLLGAGNIDIQGAIWGNITGTLSDQTDLQAEFQNVREVAEGKCKSYVLSYQAVAPADEYSVGLYYYIDNDGEKHTFQSLEEYNTYVSGLTLLNSGFNSQSGPSIFNYGGYLLLSGDDYLHYQVIKSSDFVAQVNTGDNIYIVETDVPDRWCDKRLSSSVCSCKTIRVNLSNYYTIPETNNLLNNKVDKKTTQGLWLYGHDGAEQQEKYVQEGAMPRSIPIRDGNGGIQVQAPVNDNEATNKKYVDDLIKVIKKNSYISVDIVEYPTLADFLASTGEEGYLYLYPIDTSDLTKGYKTYIYEVVSDVGSWVYMGDTSLDLTNYTRKDQDETITGSWTFENGASFSNTTSNSKWTIYEDTIGRLFFSKDNTSYWLIDGTLLRPYNTNQNDIGTANSRIKNIYLSGDAYARNLFLSNNIFNSSGSANYGLSLPDTTSWTVNKELATTDQTFNVINASDITPSNLTDDLITVLTNGKPTRINGDLLGIHNPILFPNQNVSGSGNYYGFMIGWSATSGTYQGSLVPYVILTTATPKRINLDTNPRLETYIKVLNGKTLPNYPTDLTKDYQLVQEKTSGNLVWNSFNKEIVIKLDTGTYTSGTAMSQNDYDQLSFLLNLSFEEVAKLNLKFMRVDTSRNEVHSSTDFSVRASGTDLTTNSWYDFVIKFGNWGSITLNRGNLSQQQY